jgi:hypothetical protein
VAGLLLIIAGVAKLRAPGPAAEALTVARLPSGAWLVRAASALELAAGAYVVATGGRVAAAVVLLAFAIFIGVTTRADREARSCGCFGADEAPASGWHLALCLLFAAVGVAGVAWPPPAIAGVSGVLPAVTAIVAALGAAYAAKLAFTELPGAWRAWSGGSA